MNTRFITLSLTGAARRFSAKIILTAASAMSREQRVPVTAPSTWFWLLVVEAVTAATEIEV